MVLKSKTLGALVCTALVAFMPGTGIAAPASTPITGTSPALCGAGDRREPGIQGEVPSGQTASYNCGLKAIAELPFVGAVAGTGNCVYVRDRGPGMTPDESKIHVIDVTNPVKPAEIGEPLAVHNGSETLRVAVTAQRAVMVSGSSVFDVSDCLHPKRMGEIAWPDTSVPGVARKNLPHDIRINREGTKVYASFGLWEIDISNLADPRSWKVNDYRCVIAAQLQGPWQEIHKQSIEAGRSLCDDATRKAPQGANYSMGGSALQASLLWPTFSHALDFNADDTRLYVGDQAGGTSGIWSPNTKMRIIDLTKKPYTIIGEANGPGHGLDWFRTGGREYVIHSNETGTGGLKAKPETARRTCTPYPRSTALGWGYEAIVSDVTNPASARNVGMAHIAINDPAFCDTRIASGRDPTLAYHLIDDPLDAHFAAINFGDAGLRLFDIRNPASPVEVAYFNHAPPVHAQVGYYDAVRKLIFMSDAQGFKVLQIEPQVRKKLGL